MPAADLLLHHSMDLTISMQTHLPQQPVGTDSSSVPTLLRVRPTVRFLFSHPAHLISLGLGTGLSRIAPGTMGTLLGWLSFGLLGNMLTVGEQAIFIGLGFVFGVFISGYTAMKLGTADPGAVNWDEIVAFWLVLLFIMPASFGEQLAAFLIFRFFDTVKPPPINYFDQRFSGGFGIMVDDLVAAFLTLLVISLWQTVH